ncbi:hypothetical protein ACTXT7_008275 [Hymenolepis weldensis]
MSKHLKTTLEKIRCLTSILQQNCTPNAIKLIQNYFREMLPPHCYYTPNFESNKYGNRGDGLFSSKGLESTSSASALRGSDQTHLLNDANHMETSLMIMKNSSTTGGLEYSTCFASMRAHADFDLDKIVACLTGC